MSIAERLAAVEQQDKCGTCRFYKQLPEAERKAFDEWVEKGHSLRQLHAECVKMGLEIGKSTFGEHIRTCHRKRRP